MFSNAPAPTLSSPLGSVKFISEVQFAKVLAPKLLTVALFVYEIVARFGQFSKAESPILNSSVPSKVTDFNPFKPENAPEPIKDDLITTFLRLSHAP